MSYFSSLWANIKFYRQAKAAKLWNNRISSTTYLKYPPYCKFEEKRVLNFGCGEAVYPASNVTNLDCVPAQYVTVVPVGQIALPFENETFDLILANHVMEHIPNWFDTLKEFARVLKTGGRIEIWVPPISSDSAFSYRDHINRIGIESFAGCKSISRPGTNLLAAKEFKEDMGEFRKLVFSRYSARPIVTWWTTFAPEWALSWMRTHLRNVVSEEGFFFVKGE